MSIRDLYGEQVAHLPPAEREEALRAIEVRARAWAAAHRAANPHPAQRQTDPSAVQVGWLKWIVPGLLLLYSALWLLGCVLSLIGGDLVRALVLLVPAAAFATLARRNWAARRP